MKNKWDIGRVRGGYKFVDSRRVGHIGDRDRGSLGGGIHSIYHSKYSIDHWGRVHSSGR